MPAMESVELVILVGIQASGKTMFYRQRLQDRYIHVSLDNWRGKGNVRGKERRAILEGLSAAAASAGKLRGVVVDNTNTTVQTRRRYFDYAREFARATPACAAGSTPAAREAAGVEVVCYWFDEPLKACLARNQQRPPDAPAGSPYFVPPAAIARFAGQMESPTYAEGFARIHRVRIVEAGAFVVEELPATEGP